MQTIGPKKSALVLKEPTGWFAAGDSFRQAMTTLTDGAFKLFVHVCLEADRRTGRHEVTQGELARALRKSRRIIGTYLAELEREGMCKIRTGRNQFVRTVFEVCDDYWPYVRNGHPPTKPANAPSSEDSSKARPSASPEAASERDRYVQAVRRTFLALGCTRGTFRPGDETIAGDFHDRRLPLSVVQDALVLGALRKLSAWLDGKNDGEVVSLRYFEPVVAEVAEKPFHPDYARYLRKKLAKFQTEYLAAPARANIGETPAPPRITAGGRGGETE
jgi:hypothetical protein